MVSVLAALSAPDRKEILFRFIDWINSRPEVAEVFLWVFSISASLGLVLAMYRLGRGWHE